MPTWKSIGKLSVCALLLGGCGEIGLPLPFVDNPKEDNQFSLKAKVRDFKEGNSIDNNGTHPNFNQSRWVCVGASVKTDIATNFTPDPSFPGDNRNPVLDMGMAAERARCFEPMARFADWFEDRDESINRTYLIDITFEKGSDGFYRFRNDNFFPLDNGATYQKARSGIPDPFGHLQSGTKDGVDLSQHNYGFTVEFHGTFKYEPGRGYAIQVKGDDDVWIFINDRIAQDLGGMHPVQTGFTNLDGMGLTAGHAYNIDIFFAERSIASSKLAIETNFRIAPAR